MKLALKLLIVGLLVGSGFMNAAASAPAKSSESIKSLLERPDGKKEEVISPFEYRHLSPEDKAHSVFVPECCYTVLGGGSKLTSAVVGPLCPCIMVAVRHEGLDKTLVFHVSNKNFSSQVLKVIEREFGSAIDGTKLRLRMFAERFEEGSEKQRALFEDLSDTLTKKYGLTPVQKENSIFTSRPVGVHSFYVDAGKSVFIDKDLAIYSLSIQAERIFINNQASPLDDPEKVFKLTQNGYLAVFDHCTDNYFAGCETLSGTTVFSFMCIPDSEMGLEKLAQ